MEEYFWNTKLSDGSCHPSAKMRLDGSIQFTKFHSLWVHGEPQCSEPTSGSCILHTSCPVRGPNEHLAQIIDIEKENISIEKNVHRSALQRGHLGTTDVEERVHRVCSSQLVMLQTRSCSCAPPKIDNSYPSLTFVVFPPWTNIVSLWDGWTTSISHHIPRPSLYRP